MKLSDDVIDVNVITTPDSRLLYLSIVRLGAAKDTEITRIEPRWLFNWRHQTVYEHPMSTKSVPAKTSVVSI